MKTLYTITVAYNTHVNIDWLFDACMNVKNLSVLPIVVDNSTNSIDQKFNEIYCVDRGIGYINSDGNIGLSKAYNLAIERIIRDNPDIELPNLWVMMLDQDTKVSVAYIHNIAASIVRPNSYPIKTGLISFDGYVGSPNRLSILRRVRKNGDIWTGVECINSCMTIRMDMLEKVNYYDEKLFLDQVDSLILWKLRSIGLKGIQVIDGEISQSFSGDSFTDSKSDMKRFKFYKSDTLKYVSITRDRVITMYFLVVKRWVHIRAHYLLYKLGGNI